MAVRTSYSLIIKSSIDLSSTIRAKQSGLADGGKFADEHIYLSDLATFYNTLNLS